MGEMGIRRIWKIYKTRLDHIAKKFVNAKILNKNITLCHKFFLLQIQF